MRAAATQSVSPGRPLRRLMIEIVRGNAEHWRKKKAEPAGVGRCIVGLPVITALTLTGCGNMEVERDRLSSVTSGDIVAVERIFWYDNNTLVFDGHRRNEKGPGLRQPDLYIWHPGQDRPTKHAEGAWFRGDPALGAAHLCAAEGRIVYGTGPEIVDPTTKTKTVPVMSGPIGHEQPDRLSFKITDGVPKFSELVGVRCDHLFDPAMAGREWTLNYKRTHVLDLGKIAQVKYPDGSEPEGIIGSSVLRPVDSEKGVTLPIDADAIRYAWKIHPLSWTDGFFATGEDRMSLGVDKNPFKAVPFYFIGIDGKVDAFEFPVSDQMYGSRAIPTKGGIYFASINRSGRGQGSVDYSGLFKLDRSTLKLTRVMSGRYFPRAVSPNGCRIALESAGDANGEIAVVDVCQIGD
jgi:hypothetical protein